jgi:hypothetical protein
MLFPGVPNSLEPETAKCALGFLKINCCVLRIYDWEVERQKGHWRIVRNQLVCNACRV